MIERWILFSPRSLLLLTGSLSTFTFLLLLTGTFLLLTGNLIQQHLYL
jgi:hypothetical protein